MVKLILLLVITSLSFGAIPTKPKDWDNWTFDKKRSWRGKNPDPRIPYGLLVDKLKVKEIMGRQNTVGVAKTLYATDDPQTISIDNLPGSYLMKANNACKRGLKVIDGKLTAKNKGKQISTPTPVTNEILQKFAADWLKSRYSAKYGERQYSLVTPMILFEEYLENYTMDIEFFCIYGKAHLIKAGIYRDNFRVFFYDPEWNLLKTNTNGKNLPKPEWLDKLAAFTEKLVQNIDHVRVDYIVCKDAIYFGEFTFTTGMHVVPRGLQQQLGSYWVYPEEELVGDKFGQLVFEDQDVLQSD